MRNWGVLIISSFFLSSCQEVLKGDLIGMKPKIVIECQIFNKIDNNGVVVSSTSDYYQPEESFVTNALVIISNNFGTIDTLENYITGLYRVHYNKFNGSTAKTFRLEVQVNGEIYEASSTMPDLVKIDSLGFNYYPNNIIGHEKGYYPIVYYTDPPSSKNYYLWKFYKDGTYISSNRIWISSDQSTMGKSKGFEIPYVFQKNENVKAILFTLTKEAYDFYFAVSQQYTNDGGFFSSPPANVHSNFSNGALGLFQVSTMDSLSIFLP